MKQEENKDTKEKSEKKFISRILHLNISLK